MKKQLGGQLMLTILPTVEFDNTIELTKDNCDHLDSLDSYIMKVSSGGYKFNDKITEKPIIVAFKDEDGVVYNVRLINSSDDGLDLFGEFMTNYLATLDFEVITDYDTDMNVIGYHFELTFISDRLTENVDEIVSEDIADIVGNKGSSILTSLTHSFNELDSTLKTIVESAIESQGTPVACTQAQWDAIKTLLDKSLYLGYNNASLIKTYTDGLEYYLFGDAGSNVGARMEIQFNTDDLELAIEFNQI